jgi:O-antigen ligase
VAGSIGNLFGNPNDMALHLVTMLPVAVALSLASRRVGAKLLYGACAMLMVAGNTITYSRAGFLGFIAVALVLAVKLGKRNRAGVTVATVVGLTLLVALAPNNYAQRVASIFDSGLDAVGSSHSRSDLLIRSILVSFKNPLFGVGMGNFHTVSISEQVSHNAYTQVSAEMGIPAAILYALFIVAPLMQLRRMERETLDRRQCSRFYYLSVGLQASIIGYMVSSFFASVAYLWYVYYLVGYAVCLRRIYEAQPAVDRGSGVQALRRSGRVSRRPNNECRIANQAAAG